MADAAADADVEADARADQKARTGRWLVGLTVFALFMTVLGIAVVVVLSGGL
jgi:hypothetical protein